MKLKFTPTASDDLELIWEYIARENPIAATNVTQIIMKKCHLLTENPLLGRQRHKLATNLRSFPVKN